MYTNEGELEFDEDEMAALEGQRFVAELFPDSRSELDFEVFRDALLVLVGINLRICEISIDPGHRRRCF